MFSSALVTDRARARAFALATLVIGGCPGSHGDDDGTETGGPGEATRLCGRYVECVAAVRPADEAKLGGRLGDAGTCWAGAIDGQIACVEECAAGLDKAHLDHPGAAACEPSAGLNDAIFEVGTAVFDPVDPFADPTWAALASGDPLEMVRGGQGLLMFPLALRGANFEIAADPTDYDDPKMAQVDMWMDIDGYNIGFGGHFARIYNYPIPFRPGADGVVEFLYIAVIVPDEITDPQVLDGLQGHIWIELQPFEEAPIVRELDVSIVVQQVL